MPAAAPSPRRLFFALWPDARQRAALVESIAPLQQVSGRPVPPGNLHVTLAFLGNVAADRIADLEAGVAALAWPTLELAFDRAVVWHKARLLCLEASRPPAALIAAVARLHEALGEAGFNIEHRTFRPHITVVRNLPPSPGALPDRDLQPPFVWASQGIALVESSQQRGGSIYTVLKHWPGP